MSLKAADRLTSADNLYLAAEENLANFYGNPGFAFIFEGEPPSLGELREHVERCLEQMPRLRQIVLTPPLKLGRPVWAADPAFSLEDHVHAIALSEEDSSDDALQRLIEQLFSERIGRNRAMWHLWLVSGLSDGRFALLFKTHHALGDGVAFAQYFTRVLFDSGTRAPSAASHLSAPVLPRRRELAWALLGERIRRLARAPRRIARSVLALATPGSARDVVRGAVEIAKMLAASIPEIPALNPPLSPYRRIRWLRFPLAELTTVKEAHDCKVNDVFLAIVAGALREWLTERGVEMSGVDIEVGIPVSTAATDDLARLGNHMSGLRVALPTSIDDAEERLIETRERVKAAKSSAQPLATALVTRLEEHLPTAMLRTSARLHTTRGLFNMFASNIAGPMEPLYLLGRQLQDIFPINLLMGDYAFVQTMISYRGQVCLSVVGNGSDGETVQEMVRALDRARRVLLERASSPSADLIAAEARWR